MSDAPDFSPHAAAPEVDSSGLFDFCVEQLESYLDGELDEAEAAMVRRRLAEEPAYAAALDRLHRARRLRIDALSETSVMPDDAEAAERLRAAAHEMTVRARFEQPAAASARPLNRWWAGSAVAACMLIAFGLGLYGQFDRGTPPDAIQSNPRPAGGNATVILDEADGQPRVFREVDREVDLDADLQSDNEPRRASDE